MKNSKTFLLLVAGSFPFMTLLVSGLSIYLVNRDEIVFNLADIIIPLSGLFLAISALLYLLLWQLRRFAGASNITTGILAGLSMAVWVQSQLLIWNFGHFNGKIIAWDTWKINMYIDCIVWTVIIGGCLTGFVKRKRNFEKAMVICIYFLGSVSVMVSFLNAPEKIENTIGDSEYKGIFNFSPQNNVILILLDDFQSDYFGKIADTYPRELSEFDGFTFYRNTISRFPTTKASLPSIMTGVLYKNEKPYYEYISGSHEKFNIIQAYKNKSFSTSFVGQLEGVYPEIISMEKVAYKMNNAYLYPLFEYLDLCSFRALPTFLKPFIYNNGNWFFTYRDRKNYPPLNHGADIQFLEQFEKRASVVPDMKGSFKFFHFFIPHAPLCVNENLQFDPEISGDSGYLRQARGAVKLASRILKTLKKLRLYDHAEIVILSDHGTGIQQAINHKNIYYDALQSVPPFVQTSSFALLLHKPPDSKGKLITSDAPLELSDMACLLGLCKDDTMCRGFNLAKAGGTRSRTFYYYEWDHEYWKNDYLPPMTEYIVSGTAYDPESFSRGKSVYTSKGIEPIPIHLASSSYRLGEEIVFSTDGNSKADQYVRGGWSVPEAFLRWTDGSVAGLSFHLEKAPGKGVTLRLYGFGYLGNEKLNCQVVSIIVNQVPIGRWLVKESKWYEAVIPGNLISNGFVNIVFKISNPLSPSDFEGSKDIRKLGIAVNKMVMEAIN